MNQNTQIKILLSQPKDVIITTHRNPDGDALGASLALAQYLQKKLHKVTVITPSEYPYNFGWMTGINDIIIHDDDPGLAYDKIAEADVIFALDYNALDRVDKMGAHIMQSTADKIMIDHHIDPEPFADFAISQCEASSTCELVYQFIVDQDGKSDIDKDMADKLYAGILTDTGRFRHSTSAKLYRIVADLKELGMDDLEVHDAIYNSMYEKHLRLIGHCLNNRFEVFPEAKAGLIYLTKEDYKNFNIKRGDTEGLVNYPMMMKDIRLSALIMEQPTIVKLSLRSKGDLSVQEIARKHFHGGGHKNASGGYMHGSLEKTIQKFKEVLPLLSTK